MNQQVHFDDNLFYLNLLIRTYRDGWKLPLDAEFFLGKAIEDLDYLDSVLNRLQDWLSKNPHLVQRVDYLQNLASTKTAYARLLNDLLAPNHPFAAALAPYRDDLTRQERSHLQQTQELRQEIRHSLGGSSESDDVISPEELSLLMQDQES